MESKKKKKKVLHCHVILVILMNGIGPVYKGLGSIDLVDMIHHVEREFRGQEGKSGRGVERVLCLMGQGFELHKEDVHLILSHEEVVEAHFCAFHSTCVPEGVFKSVEDFIPVMFIIGRSSHGKLINGPVGPSLYPILDVGTFDESQKKGCTLHGVGHLFRVYVGDVI
jgi:hypothetical protein